MVRAVALSQKTSWLVDEYQTSHGGYDFTHFVVHHGGGSSSLDGVDARDVWLRFHGSGPLDAVKARSSLDQSLEWIVDSGDERTIYAFITTETTHGGFHSLCADEAAGINTRHEHGDWGYALVGGAALDRHLTRLGAYGYDPAVSRLTAVGYSDGGWLASMCALRGVARRAVAWAGWSFDGFARWRHLLPRNDIYGMRLDLYVSAGDAFYPVAASVVLTT